MRPPSGLWSRERRPTLTDATRRRYPVLVATLTRRDVEHVAHLARLGLSEEEVTQLEGQLNHILEQFVVLSELDTDAIPPTARVIELENILRDDVVRPGLEPEVALANAPERSGDHFVVPAVLGDQNREERGD
jgi:aspartyl-tRNA(Asn)/glutamyl-tRNA(Gln) amidotransferase subunit C